MSDRTLWKLWGICLIVNSVCGIILNVLNIIGSERAKMLAPILCVPILLAVVGILITTVQIWKRRKK